MDSNAEELKKLRNDKTRLLDECRRLRDHRDEILGHYERLKKDHTKTVKNYRSERGRSRRRLRERDELREQNYKLMNEHDAQLALTDTVRKETVSVQEENKVLRSRIAAISDPLRSLHPLQAPGQNTTGEASRRRSSSRQIKEEDEPLAKLSSLLDSDDQQLEGFMGKADETLLDTTPTTLKPKGGSRVSKQKVNGKAAGKKKKPTMNTAKGSRYVNDKRRQPGHIHQSRRAGAGKGKRRVPRHDRKDPCTIL